MTMLERESMWAERHAAYKLSGQTKKAWCKNNNIDTKSFYRWGSRLTARNNEQQQKQFVLVQDEAEVCLNASQISITVGKATINIIRGVDIEALEKVLHVVSRIC